ncbi:Hypothetical predicted protein [Prunus dulcis]|uniref:Uncharacterized protein n=1 Tax=Prunus dulcis TaxID=3755 RepID=A0A5E4FH32_PRUDU|nr:Hypothetical predicted protein [Prunus dulcis]
MAQRRDLQELDPESSGLQGNHFHPSNCYVAEKNRQSCGTCYDYQNLLLSELGLLHPVLQVAKPEHTDLVDGGRLRLLLDELPSTTHSVKPSTKSVGVSSKSTKRLLIWRALIFELSLSQAGQASSSNLFASFSKQLLAVSRQASNTTNSKGKTFATSKERRPIICFLTVHLEEESVQFCSCPRWECGYGDGSMAAVVSLAISVFGERNPSHQKRESVLIGERGNVNSRGG